MPKSKEPCFTFETGLWIRDLWPFRRNREYLCYGNNAELIVQCYFSLLYPYYAFLSAPSTDHFKTAVTFKITHPFVHKRASVLPLRCISYINIHVPNRLWRAHGLTSPVNGLLPSKCKYMTPNLWLKMVVDNSAVRRINKTTSDSSVSFQWS